MNLIKHYKLGVILFKSELNIVIVVFPRQRRPLTVHNIFVNLIYVKLIILRGFIQFSDEVPKKFHQNSCFFISTAYILRALDGTPAERTFLKQRLAFGKLFQQMPRHFRISPSSTTEQSLPSLIQCTDDHERSLTCCTPERESKQPLLLCPSGKLWVLPASEI